MMQFGEIPDPAPAAAAISRRGAWAALVLVP